MSSTRWSIAAIARIIATRASSTWSRCQCSFDQDPPEPATTPLRFPGKVLADEAGDRLFIADSNHNRIVVTTLDGIEVLDVIGSGGAAG